MEGNEEEEREREREREREEEKDEIGDKADLVITMETASFSTLSPNTSMFRVGLTSRAWNMASVATGSTADIRAPNVKLKKIIKTKRPMRKMREERK